MKELDYDQHDAGEQRGFSMGRNRGRLFKGASAPDTTTSTNKMEPPDQVKPYIAPYLEHASSIAMTPYQSYGGQQIAGFNNDQQAGFGMARDVANKSQQMLQNGNDRLYDTMSGAALDYRPGSAGVGTNALLGLDNPYLNRAIDDSMGDITKHYNNTVANNTDAMMARSGAFGGSSWAQAQNQNVDTMTQNLGRTSNDMRMTDYALQAQLGEADVARRMQNSQFNTGLNDSAYQSERARMLQAVGMLPGMAQAGYTNSAALLGVGDAQQGMEQGHLDLAYQNWLNQQNHPSNQLNTMGGALGQMMGAGGTQTGVQTGATPQRNGTASALGGALSGAAAGTAIMPGWGTAIGAGVGLLGGMM